MRTPVLLAAFSMQAQVLAFETRIITHKQAAPFIREHHYSRNLPAGKNVNFGAYVDGELYAVASFGIGVCMTSPENLLTRLSGLPKGAITKNNLYELKRLARPGKRGESKISLTSFLAECHKFLRDKEIRFVFSFSDPMHDHCGGIYRASNFFHLGQTAEETHYLDSEGNFVHRRIPYRHMQKNNADLAKKLLPAEFAAACEAERKQLDAEKKGGRTWPKVTGEIKHRQSLRLLGDTAVRSYIAQAKLDGYTPLKTERKDRWFLPLFRNDFRRVAKHVRQQDAGQLQEAPTVPPLEGQFEAAVPLQIPLQTAKLDFSLYN